MDKQKFILLQEVLRFPNGRFMSNSDGEFRVVTDLGRQVGLKDETSLRIAAGENGKI
ncbi:hypothetical protein N473_02825 [Pseudoalteromonas luteoviolacea CPMOR-1]|uniref:Uncharacterized protein n=1 Tax=Pseudoalteromonas luteoviolacea CPMOR-1 TaxID=1365248 RepID=A0A167IS03_9GAMM|nr:hypothetical protein N473_02825 [Pseudoalteromonas luteoviolacea CPMOR-1]